MMLQNIDLRGSPLTANDNISILRVLLLKCLYYGTKQADAKSVSQQIYVNEQDRKRKLSGARAKLEWR